MACKSLAVRLCAWPGAEKLELSVPENLTLGDTPETIIIAGRAFW